MTNTVYFHNTIWDAESDSSTATETEDEETPHTSNRYTHQQGEDESRAFNNLKLALGSKLYQVSEVLGRAGTVGLGKAMDVLDTLGSSMTNLNVNSGFTQRTTSKGFKISILAFEVANTILKGAALMQSLSKENIKHLKEVVLPSEGVQHLVSKDTEELLKIAASDKREELKVFSGEVFRFGNRCKVRQWHNLLRSFEEMGSKVGAQKQPKEAETIMHHLMTMVQYTVELYHELHALDRFEQDYRRKHQEEDNSSATQRGDSLAILRTELKSQRKHVKSLKKKSLWSKVFEEVMEKLVYIVQFIHLEIRDAFGSADIEEPVKVSQNNHRRLGPAGLGLQYANIITQIDTIVSRSRIVPPDTRDNLYQGLPPSVKSVLRSKLQSFQVKEELTIPQIKAEMEKTLQWLAPIASNTTKAHHDFGWVGEWVSTGAEVNKKHTGQTELIKIETLHHADKERTEACILELIVWLNHLISQSRSGLGIRSPSEKTVGQPTQNPNSSSPILTFEDKEMLRDVNKRIPVVDYFDIDKIKALDVIDRVDTL